MTTYLIKQLHRQLLENLFEQLFVEEDTPAAQAALKKKVIAKTIDMLSGKIVRPATKSLALTKSANSVKKYKSNKKANGAIL